MQGSTKPLPACPANGSFYGVGLVKSGRPPVHCSLLQGGLFQRGGVGERKKTDDDASAPTATRLLMQPHVYGFRFVR